MRWAGVTNALLDKWGGPNQIPLVEAKCENDEWENAIRRMGVVNACMRKDLCGTEQLS